MINSNKKYGFTLMELMVAVIIIAVLAAVAVPQYKKAVLKSRFSTLMPVANSLAKGNEVYYLANGTYTDKLSALDITQYEEDSLEGVKALLYHEADNLSYVRLSNDNLSNVRYLVYQKHSANFPDTTQCEASDPQGEDVCKSFGGTKISDVGTQSGWVPYLLTGTKSDEDSFATVTGGEEDNGEDDSNEQLPAPTCPEEEKPSDISNSNTTGTAKCVNGKWVYEWTGRITTTAQRCNVNLPTGPNTCAGYIFTRDMSECSVQDSSSQGCIGVDLEGKSSSCSAFGPYSCNYATFNGDESSCSARAVGSCTNSTFSGNKTKCGGYTENGCANSTFQAGSYCQANVPGACAGATYTAHPDKDSSLTGCCFSERGYCPSGSPRCKQDGWSPVWNASTQAYDIEGVWP